ncbi:MAG TPA: DUF1697 domain-containing protein [Arsenicitalea sp.]|jgi:uncharacterized protein (DUF1697 family)|nr:DUF1697 domain-containing protein [Arsenicitalea sp.]
MTVLVAFLRGVNLGKRKVLSADLKHAFDAMGFSGARTLLASGNVVFEAEESPGLAARIEQGLEQKFGFPIGVVLRSQEALRAMIAADPFAAIPKDADAKLYVALLHDPVGGTLPKPLRAEGDFDVLSATDYDIFAVAWRMADGRYGAGLDQIGKHFGKGVLITTRNWNTILKAAD